MKFWHYAIGTGIAILIFSGAIFSEYSKYERVSFLNKNPFSLLGRQENKEAGYYDLMIDTGEMIRVFDGTDIVINDKSREIYNGVAFFSGGLFADSNSDLSNKINFNGFELDFLNSNVLVRRNSEKLLTEIQNYGQSVYLYFDKNSLPFLIPSETKITIDESDNFTEFSNENYYEFSKKLSLSRIDLMSTEGSVITKGIDDYYVVRNSFQTFANNIPLLWEKGLTNKLKKLSPNNKSGDKELKYITEKILEIKKHFDKGDEKSINLAKVESISLNNSILNARKKLKNIKYWDSFEKSQKIWLSVLNKYSNKYSYNELWKEKLYGIDMAIKKAKIAENLKKDFRSEKIDENLIEIKENIENIDFKNIETEKISELRRIIFRILYNQIVSQNNVSLEVVALHNFLAQKETDNQDIKHEIIHNALDIINRNIDKDEKTTILIVKEFIKLMNSLGIKSISEKNKKIFSEEELFTIEDIKLVGLSEMTPKEIRLINKIKRSEEELNKLIDNNEDQTEKNKTENSNKVSTSKKLWKFLRTQEINLDIKEFRTKRNSLVFETVFANTETGKKKIYGIFDYRKQNFEKISLGEASTRNLPTYQMAAWIKSIEGKFETVKEDVKNEIIEDNIIKQDSRTALVNRQFLKDLLESLSLSTTKNNIIISNEEGTQLNAKNVKLVGPEFEKINIILSYDIENHLFYDIYIDNKKEGKTLLSSDKINDRMLQKILKENLTKEDKSD